MNKPKLKLKHIKGSLNRFEVVITYYDSSMMSIPEDIKKQVSIVNLYIESVKTVTAREYGYEQT